MTTFVHFALINLFCCGFWLLVSLPLGLSLGQLESHASNIEEQKSYLRFRMPEHDWLGSVFRKLGLTPKWGPNGYATKAIKINGPKFKAMIDNIPAGTVFYLPVKSLPASANYTVDSEGFVVFTVRARKYRGPDDSPPKRWLASLKNKPAPKKHQPQIEKEIEVEIVKAPQVISQAETKMDTTEVQPPTAVHNAKPANKEGNVHQAKRIFSKKRDGIPTYQITMEKSEEPKKKSSMEIKRNGNNNLDVTFYYECGKESDIQSWLDKAIEGLKTLPDRSVDITLSFEPECKRLQEKVYPVFILTSSELRDELDRRSGIKRAKKREAQRRIASASAKAKAAKKKKTLTKPLKPSFDVDP